MANLQVLSKANHAKKTAPIKIMQFGEGNFLRAFIDWMIQKMNDSGKYEGHVVVVQPLPLGRVKELAEQDGLYTLILQGLDENGQPVRTHDVIDVLDDFVNPYVDYKKYLDYAESKDLEVIISNTTEAGIAFEQKDVALDFEKEVPSSYPAKLYALLEHRFHTIGASYPLAIMPCELIDDNGDKLREVLLQIASARNAEKDLVDFIANKCHYTSSLVDRIVPGFPRDEFHNLCEEFGYIDNSMVKGEYFHLYVLKNEPFCEEKFPVHTVGLHAIYVPDVHPYKKRKVRILNGSHTSLVPVAYLAGFNEVRESLLDEQIKKFLVDEIQNETLPTITAKGTEEFAADVLKRFLNPYVHHALMSIALNSIPKYKERDLPIVLDDIKLGITPKHLLFAFAALAKFYAGKRVVNGVEEAIALKDDQANLDALASYWKEFEADHSYENFAAKFLGNVSFWGQDLSKNETIRVNFTKYLKDINEASSAYEAVKEFNAQ